MGDKMSDPVSKAANAFMSQAEGMGSSAEKLIKGTAGALTSVTVAMAAVGSVMAAPTGEVPASPDANHAMAKATAQMQVDGYKRVQQQAEAAGIDCASLGKAFDERIGSEAAFGTLMERRNGEAYAKAKLEVGLEDARAKARAVVETRCPNITLK